MTSPDISTHTEAKLSRSDVLVALTGSAHPFAMDAESNLSQGRKRRTKRLAIIATEKGSGEGATKSWTSKRPTNRSQCIGRPRPCPWVGCKHNLMLDVRSEAGSLILNYPATEGYGNNRPGTISRRMSAARFDTLTDEFIEHMQERKMPSCLLDVVDEYGAITLEDSGDLLCVTRERIRQIETKGLKNFAEQGVRLGLFETEDLAIEFVRMMKRYAGL